MDDEQQTLDKALGVSADEREQLRSGVIPPRIRARLRRRGGGARPPGLLLVLAAAAALGVWVASGNTLLALAIALVAALPMTVLWLRDWRRRRSVAQVVPELRVFDGRVETRRAWHFGYGEVYYLWSEVAFITGEHAGEEVSLGTQIGKHVIEGPIRIWVATVVLGPGAVVPFYDHPLAIELLEGATLDERAPANPPPDELYLTNVPAD